MTEEQPLQATEESIKAKYHANLAFWHIGQLDTLLMPTAGTCILSIPLLATIRYVKPEFFDTILEQAPKFWYVVGAFTAVGTVGQIATNLMIDRIQKVNTSLSLEGKLQTNGLFGLIRHPLYATKTAAIIGASLMSLNPLGWILGLKGLYHASRGCEEEEKSLEIIYG